MHFSIDQFMKIKTSCLLFILGGILFSSCNDMKDMPTPNFLPNTSNETGKMYVLSEGLFNMNNSTLSCVNFEDRTINYDFFGFSNKRGLGDTANDMKLYGTKLWIIVNVSSQVEVVDAITGLSIRRIPVTNDNGEARQPRYIAFDKNKAYVCSFDGTVARIDTNSLTIEAITTCGRNPDGIAVANGKLYVSNSGGLDPNYDRTVSVIDLETFIELKKITVGINPYKIEADSEGDIYAVSRGNNGSIKASWSRIDSETDEVIQSFYSIAAVNFTIRNDTAYLYNYDFVTELYWIKTFDCKTEKIIASNFISDATNLVHPFGIYVHPTNGNVYLLDALNYTVKGNLLCFDKKGKLKYKIEGVGMNPNTVLITNF